MKWVERWILAILAAFAIAVIASHAFAFEPGEVRTTDLICSDEDAVVTIAKQIDQDFFLDKQDRAFELIMVAVQARLRGWAKGDASHYTFKLVRQVWVGDHIEVWEVESLTHPEADHAYVGFKSRERSVQQQP